RVAVDALVREDRLAAQPVARQEVPRVRRDAPGEVLDDLLLDPRQRGARHRRARAHRADALGLEPEPVRRRGPEAELPEAAAPAAREDHRVEGRGRHQPSAYRVGRPTGTTIPPAGGLPYRRSASRRRPGASSGGTPVRTRSRAARRRPRPGPPRWPPPPG